MSGPALDPARFGARSAQPLENFIGDAQSIVESLFGKSDPKDIPASAQAAIEQQARLRSIAARKFGDADGEELLEFLCDQALRRPFMLPPTSCSAEQALRYADQREGQAQTMFFLLALIAEGRGEQAPQREGHHANNRKRAPRQHRPAPVSVPRKRNRRR